MRSVTVRATSIVAFLLLGFASGCGRKQTKSPVLLIVSTVPTNGATSVPVAQIITATFNQAMNPATIDSSTFLVTAPGGVSVGGTVTYSGTTATFTPLALLSPSTSYTATITTGAQTLVGNGFASDYLLELYHRNYPLGNFY